MITMDGNVKLGEIGQVAIVVRDLRRAMEHFWNIFGIGPWSVYTYTPPDLTDMTVRGKPEPYSMRLALATMGSVMLELIQPLEGKSIYKEFLDEKGEGLHHIACFKVDDIERVVEELGRRGIGVLQSGRWRGGHFVYMDTEEKLGTVIELVKRLGPRPPPKWTYP